MKGGKHGVKHAEEKPGSIEKRFIENDKNHYLPDDEINQVYQTHARQS
jgi:hypothetical protein